MLMPFMVLALVMRPIMVIIKMIAIDDSNENIILNNDNSDNTDENDDKD